MAITAALVKELREKSGAGMMDAKKALTETDGDMEAAQDWLRTKGLAKAEKKSGRTAAEGLVGVSASGGTAVAVEINSETDFVAKNAEFQAMVASIASVAATVDDIEALKTAKIDGKPVADVVTDAVAKIGENMGVRRMAKLSGDNVATYIHNAAAEGMGKIGVLVAYTGDDAEFARGVGMHIAAINPAALSEADLDADTVEKEKQIQMDIARESGKPEAVIEKMIGGRMQKWLSEVTLLNQPYVKSEDGKTTVGKAAEAAGVTITGFVRLEVGEGIEKVEEDFAAEVAKAAKG
ncbi:translation elongation factor Ts [Boseongicola aestuarii]|jgi:elongation factor Ts|uniref:Elongation factor Ts n=1 Tax=Boseongicola aestuarii TaxID=1470561 RepID=A0A238IWZ0_9RHOB|nr:translation elongation factor Ts [Boseongicola aestuarii]SMX22194.1 Elongation factor Ts [Boseongicola aestuarii]